MLLKQANGFLNLAHAFEFNYNESKSALFVRWSLPLPAQSDNRQFAELYDSNRMCYYSVSVGDWKHFLASNGW